jgi:hypothetical protein
MPYSVYAGVGVNSRRLLGEIEKDYLAMCSAMMVEMWLVKRVMGDEDENHMHDMSGYGTSGEQLARFCRKDIVSV